MKNMFKKCASLLMLILLVAGLAAAAVPALAETATVEETVQATPVKPTSVKLSTSKTIKLAIGSELTLTPTLSPENAETTFSWKSSSKKIASVSGGVVKAKKVGVTTITVTTANKKKSTVKIKVYDPYKPTSVKLDQKGTVKVPIGESLTLNATLYPETAQSGLKWKSSKKKIASVSGGVVKAKKVGTTTVTVTTRNKKKAKVKIKVYDPYLPSSVKFDKSGTQTLMVGNGMPLTAILSPATAQSGLKWKSSNKKVAVVSSEGWVGGLAPGTTKITVTTRNKKKATIKIKVMDDGKQPITTPEGYNLPYVIYACKNSHTIAILARDSNGEWNRVIRLFPTGTGRKNVTDVGFYTLSKKERWHKWGSGYSPYANKLSIGIYLHGPIYKSKNQNTIRPSYYNCIGTDCSSGCLRTVCGCAAWVYYNCPVGTMVIIGQNSRFSTPRPTKISKNATKDPTDPGSNPEILITNFSVNPGTLTLDQGATQQLVPYNASPSNNSTGNNFTFSTTDKSVATVSSSGVVTAVGPGTASILVVANDAYKASTLVPVTVNGATAAKVEAEASIVVPDDVIVAEAQLSVEEAVPAADEVVAEAEPVADEPADAVAEPADVETDVAASDEADATDISGEDNGLSSEFEAVSEEITEIIIAEEE